jgi:transposase
MEKQDARSLPPAAQQALRHRAIQAVLRGESQTAVAKTFGLSRASVAKWISLYRKNGEKALNGAKRGRPKRIQLEASQAAQVVRTITDHCPDQIKLPWVLWTRDAVVQLIKERYGINISRWTAGRYLKLWGFTPQVPAKRALEQNPEEVRRWLDFEYPAIHAAAKAEDAEIHWGDEMGIRSDHQSGRTWGIKGKTPVVAQTGQRFSCNMISTITNRGSMRFMIYQKRFTVEVFLTFLRRLIGSVGHKVYLIVDNHSVHRAKKVKKWLERHKTQIAIFYLPPYSPQLNPDEYLNNDIKNNASKSRRPSNKKELQENVRYYLRVTQRRPEVVRRFFRAPKVAYAA